MSSTPPRNSDFSASPAFNARSKLSRVGSSAFTASPTRIRENPAAPAPHACARSRTPPAIAPTGRLPSRAPLLTFPAPSPARSARVRQAGADRRLLHQHHPLAAIRAAHPVPAVLFLIFRSSLPYLYSFRFVQNFVK